LNYRIYLAFGDSIITFNIYVARCLFDGDFQSG